MTGCEGGPSIFNFVLTICQMLGIFNVYFYISFIHLFIIY